MPIAKLGQLALVALSYKTAIVKAALVVGGALFQRRTNRRLRAAARDASAIAISLKGSGLPLPLVFGRFAVDCVMAFPPDVSNNFPTHGSVPATKGVFGTLRPRNGKHREFWMTQWAISAGYINRGLGLTIDGVESTNSRISRLHYAHVHQDGVASPVATAFSAKRDATARSTGNACLTLVQRHDRDKPGFFGAPVRVRLYGEAKMARRITRTGDPGSYTYTLGDYTADTNAIAQRLGVMTSTRFGPGKPVDEIHLPSWYDAQTIADQIVQGAQSAWDTPYPTDFNAEDGTNYINYSDLFGHYGFGGPADTGFRIGAIGNPAARLSGPLKRHELNGAIAGDLPFEDLLDAIDAHIPGIITFDDDEGKERVSVPDPNAAPVSVRSIGYEDIVASIAIADPSPDEDSLANRFIADYAEINKDFAPSQVVYPANDGLLDRAWVQADGSRLTEEWQLPLANNMYHARSLTGGRAHLARRRFVSVPGVPDFMGLDPGQHVTLKAEIGGEDTIYRIMNRFADENLEPIIELSEYVPSDFAWRGAVKDETAPAQVADVDIGAVQSVTATLSEGVVTVTWVPNANESATVVGYEIRGSTDGGVTWTAVARADEESTQWSGIPALEGVERLRYQVRPRTAAGAVAAWVSSTDIAVESFAVPGPVSPEGLVAYYIMDGGALTNYADGDNVWADAVLED